jgi:tetratricopeptide (TPR) repeat protein
VRTKKNHCRISCTPKL